ncbi:MAG: T9SS type A sorting domain-containing protein [bacterium]|uniref:T9SS type A sorting domain-containing protein n=1 Tax=Candidatus Aphodosoma intestinipullorum TaxID=2840674 RepID=A0A940IE98_9BACT|nr:T9SS type A sorting domain-containing protein [Candidatus Aphodosoma intestinipullorum]
MPLCLLSLSGAAQVAGYSCDFEDSTQDTLWELNAGPFGERCTNKWYIGTGANNGGERGMYISYDDGKTAGYISGSGKGQVVSAYTLISHLPADNYEISFDWQAMGMDEDALYVCWVPESVFSNSTDQTSSLPTYVSDYGIRVGGRSGLNNSLWNSSYGSFHHDGTPHKLCFVWRNGVSGSVSPAGCVDNIMIIPLSSCKKPTEITLTPTDTVIGIKWDGKSDAYDIRIKSRENGQWYEFWNHPSDSIAVSGIPEGTIEVYVRAHCDDFYSVWVSKVEFIYYPGLRCVDFLNIHSKNCFYGTTQNPAASTGMVDAGYESENSRHTIHYLDYETDPRTNDALKTVSDFDIASVRLGNWLVNSQAERIEYEYTVDEDESAVLLLHYAVVLQLPDHDKERQPRFTLKVTDAKGNALDEDGCTEADFAEGFETSGSEGWVQIGEAGDDDAVVWKDWTTVGVNLEKYAGQKLKIALTTYDCADGAHYGYAYFAVSCTSGKLEMLGCGESENNKFRAPDGFLYRWYKRTEPDITVSEEQELSLVQGDTTTYCCDVILKMNENCYFTLTANALPRFPVAAAQYEMVVRDCQNVVKFTDESHVVFRRGDEDVISEEELCDSVIWNFGDGSYSREWSPEHVFPYEGGTFEVTQRVFLAGECDSVSTYMVEVPAMDIPRDTIHAVICDGESYPFADGNYFVTGCFSDTIIGGAADGCDSISVLDLTVGEVYEINDTAITCTDNLPYMFNGKPLTETGIYTDTFRTVYDCDSVVTLDLTVNESLNIDFPLEVDVCADAGVADIPYTVTSGVATSYDVVFADGAMEDVDSGIPDAETFPIPLPEEVVPGRYAMEIRFANADCGDVVREAVLNVLYPDSIVVQRWNDVLAVRNAEWNGGYEFVAYQWYKDGQPLTGEIGSVLYQTDGLDPAGMYYVGLTRTDGVTVNSCAVKPERYGDGEIEVTPTVTFSGGSVTLKSSAPGVMRVWSVTGQLVSTEEFSTGETSVVINGTPGTYLVEIRLKDGHTKVEKIMVRDVR